MRDTLESHEDKAQGMRGSQGLQSNTAMLWLSLKNGLKEGDRNSEARLRGTRGERQRSPVSAFLCHTGHPSHTGLLSRLCLIQLREDINGKKRFLSGISPMKGGGGLSMPDFFGPFSRSAFFVNIKSLFFQKCLCIELLTVYRLHI